MDGPEDDHQIAPQPLLLPTAKAGEGQKMQMNILHAAAATDEAAADARLEHVVAAVRKKFPFMGKYRKGLLPGNGNGEWPPVRRLLRPSVRP